MKKEALVKNVADPQQVRDAGVKVKMERDRELEDIRFILTLQEGRRFLSRVLAKFKVAQLHWRPGAEINRDVGHFECASFILGEIVRADAAIGAQMLTEAYQAELEKE